VTVWHAAARGAPHTCCRMKLLSPLVALLLVAAPARPTAGARALR
jgi:hypothetical protein